MIVADTHHGAGSASSDSWSRPNYFKSPDFPIHAMGFWWLMWMAISLSPLNELLKPSWATMGQCLLLVSSFFAGHAAMKWFRPFDPTVREAAKASAISGSMRRAMFFAAIGCCLMLVISLKLSGALSTGFVDYFVRLRVALSEGDFSTLTNVHSLDILTKILAFPLSYTVMVILLSVELETSKGTFVICLINMLAFAYLWQVNYPLVHMFWFMIFYMLLTAQRRGRFNRKILTFSSLIMTVLVASAVNRGGTDLTGALQHYIIDYHVIGFTFYDQQFQDPQSILHNLSFGRSSLGFLDQVLEVLLKPFSVGYHAASSENADYNDIPLDIGATDSIQFNAFGTIMFSLYRDFNVFGLVMGGFAYGAIATRMRYLSGHSWFAGAVFLMLAAAWMMGMMVSPLEAAYFWFTIVALAIFNVVNRGVRL